MSSPDASSPRGSASHQPPSARSEYSPRADEEPGMQLMPPGVVPDGLDEHSGEGGEGGEAGEEAHKHGHVHGKAPPAAPHPFARHLSILGLLIFASIWGTLTREGLVALNTYSGQSITPVIWAQAFGCLVMGWTAANKDALEAIYPPLFIMLGTGYCGSVTTFSTWIIDVFLAYSNQEHWDRHGLHNVMDALTQTGATLGLSLAALSAGKTLGKWASLARVTERLPQRIRRHRAAPATSSSTVVVDVAIFLVLGLDFWLGAALLAGLPPRANFRPTTFSIVFGPPGAILRWYLARLNSLPRSKSHRPYWPLGTFTANISATAVIAALFVAQHVGHASADPLGPHGVRTKIGCQVLYGLQEGFCGCLSTISTFAVELSSIKPRRRAFGYALGSYAIGAALCVVIVGGPWWSVGMEGSCSMA